MLWDSKDERVREAGIIVRTGRKWSASRALREAEDRLHHADIVGPGKAGSGLQLQNKLTQRRGEAWCKERSERPRRNTSMSSRSKAAGQDGRG